MKRLPPLRTYASPSSTRLGAHRRRVRARARLGQRVRREPLSAREPRQEALLLLVRPGQLDAQRAELLDGHDQARRRADLGQLLDRDEHHQRARPGAAVLLLEGQPEKVVLAEELDHVPRELGLLVDLGRARGDALAGERAHEVADLALLVGQRVVGHGEESICGQAAGARARATRASPRHPAAMHASSYAFASSAARSRKLTSRATISS